MTEFIFKILNPSVIVNLNRYVIETTKSKMQITFGKYKMKTFEYVLNNDFNYCSWILTQNSKHPNMLNFKQYIQHNSDEQQFTIPKGLINVSRLSRFYYNNPLILDLFSGLFIEKKSIIKLTDNNIYNLPSTIYGSYIDYLIRYKICCINNLIFDDARCNDILYSDIDDIFIRLITNSYTKMKNKVATYNDILNVSISHAVWFGEMDALFYCNAFCDNYNYDMFDNYLKVKFINRHILLNPTLRNNELEIGGDADIINNKELIDIKCSKHIGSNMNDYIQLFIYITLYYCSTNIKCTKISILNPILGYEYYINLSNWDRYDDLIYILQQRNI